MSKPEDSFYDIFSKSHLLVKESPLKTKQKNNELVIGVPKESNLEENRVALVPTSVKNLVLNGYKVIVEAGAGEKSSYSDINYSEAGATVSQSKEEVFKSSIILKALPPTLKETDYFQNEQILISPLEIYSTSKELLQKMLQKRIVAISMEDIKAADSSLPFVQIMSEIAGSMAVLNATEYLTQSTENRILLGGISGIPPAKVVVLGADMAGEYAIKTAIALGASVTVFDNDIFKITKLKSKVNYNLHTSILEPVYLEKQLQSADIVIAAINSKNGITPMIITEDMVMKMKKGAIIVDLSIKQGGCVETSKITTISNPTFVKHGVLHYCVPNITSKVSKTASIATSNIITQLILETELFGNIESILYQKYGLKTGIYTYKGRLTNEHLANKFDIKFTPLDLMITSSM